MFELNTTLNEWVEIAELTLKGADQGGPGANMNYFGSGGTMNGDLVFSAPVRLPQGVGAVVHNLSGIITPVAESAQLPSTQTPQVSTGDNPSEMSTRCAQDRYP